MRGLDETSLLEKPHCHRLLECPRRKGSGHQVPCLTDWRIRTPKGAEVAKGQGQEQRLRISSPSLLSYLPPLLFERNESGFWKYFSRIREY